MYSCAPSTSTESSNNVIFPHIIRALRNIPVISNVLSPTNTCTQVFQVHLDDVVSSVHAAIDHELTCSGKGWIYNEPSMILCTTSASADEINISTTIYLDRYMFDKRDENKDSLERLRRKRMEIRSKKEDLQRTRASLNGMTDAPQITLLQSLLQSLNSDGQDIYPARSCQALGISETTMSSLKTILQTTEAERKKKINKQKALIKADEEELRSAEEQEKKYERIFEHDHDSEYTIFGVTVDDKEYVRARGNGDEWAELESGRLVLWENMKTRTSLLYIKKDMDKLIDEEVRERIVREIQSEDKKPCKGETTTIEEEARTEEELTSTTTKETKKKTTIGDTANEDMEEAVDRSVEDVEEQEEPCESTVHKEELMVHVHEEPVEAATSEASEASTEAVEEELTSTRTGEQSMKTATAPNEVDTGRIDDQMGEEESAETTDIHEEEMGAVKDEKKRTERTTIDRKSEEDLPFGDWHGQGSTQQAAIEDDIDNCVEEDGNTDEMSILEREDTALEPVTVEEGAMERDLQGYGLPPVLPTFPNLDEEIRQRRKRRLERKQMMVVKKSRCNIVPNEVINSQTQQHANKYMRASDCYKFFSFPWKGGQLVEMTRNWQEQSVRRLENLCTKHIDKWTREQCTDSSAESLVQPIVLEVYGMMNRINRVTDETVSGLLNGAFEKYVSNLKEYEKERLPIGDIVTFSFHRESPLPPQIVAVLLVRGLMHLTSSMMVRHPQDKEARGLNSMTTHILQLFDRSKLLLGSPLVREVSAAYDVHLMSCTLYSNLTERLSNVFTQDKELRPLKDKSIELIDEYAEECIETAEECIHLSACMDCPQLYFNKNSARVLLLACFIACLQRLLWMCFLISHFDDEEKNQPLLKNIKTARSHLSVLVRYLKEDRETSAETRQVFTSLQVSRARSISQVCHAGVTQREREILKTGLLMNAEITDDREFVPLFILQRGLARERAVLIPEMKQKIGYEENPRAFLHTMCDNLGKWILANILN